VEVKSEKGRQEQLQVCMRAWVCVRTHIYARGIGYTAALLY
jgi:hypothetical protein